jgi:Pyridoxamine 5'-phosphate oxidase
VLGLPNEGDEVPGPVADRPYIAHPEYGVPEHLDELLEWPSVAERLMASHNYWICTCSPDGTPHARPTWGVFVEGNICFGGGPNTRWSRNLTTNPRVSIHLESATEVVMLEGIVDRITEGTDPRLMDIDDAYEAKYDMRHGPPMWLVTPDIVIAWTDFPKDATRFRF